MRTKILIVVSSALLSACAVGPDFKAPEPALPQQWRAPAVTSDAIEQQWWKQFHDAFLSYGGPPIPLVRKAMIGADDKGSLF